MGGKKKSSDARALRQKAVELLRKSPEQLKEISPDDMSRLLEELRIQRAELEIQNEELRRAQLDLQASRNKYYDLYDFAPVGFFTLDEKGKILEVNLKGSSLLGREGKILKKSLFSAYISDMDLLRYRDFFQKLLRSHTEQRIVLKMVREDSGEISADLSGRVFLNSSNELNVRLAISDISRQREAEEAMAANEEKFRAIAENAGLLIGIIREQKFEYVNPYVKSVLGYSPAEVVSMDLKDLVHPDDRRRVLENARQRMQGENVAPSYEVRVITKSGETRWLELNMSVAEIHRQRTIIGSGIDRTKEKKLFRELEAERTRLAAILENAPEGIIVVDEKARIISANTRAREYYRRPVPVGQHFRSHAEMQLCYPDGTRYKPEDLPLTRCVFEGVSQTGLEMGIRWPDGEFRNFLVNTTPLRDESGKITGAIGIMQDVTEQKNNEKELAKYRERLEEKVAERTQELAAKNRELQDQMLVRMEKELELKNTLEKLEQSNRDLRDFAFMASHDLQEPLRKIQSFGERLFSKYGRELDEQGQDYLRRMQSASGRMRRLIQDLLEFSRITTRAKPFRRVDLNEALAEALDHLEQPIEQTGARIENSELPTIEGEPLQMVQLFQNLVGNALKFCRDRKEPLVHISHEIIPAEEETKTTGQQVVIVVEDNGIGFPAESAEKVFTPFQTFHSPQKYEGTGMGLAICRRIVERHSGTITAEGEPGEGARFIVKLPVKQKNTGAENGKQA